MGRLSAHFFLKGMDAMYSDVEIKIKRKNKILFSRDSQCLQELIKLIEVQNHRTLVLWVLDCANTTLAKFEAKYPNEGRPRTALELCEAWARGRIKMPAAKRAILDAHAVAKEIEDDEYGALAHAIGHAGAATHVETHGIGLVIYELTSIVLRHGKEEYQIPVDEKIDYYYQRLLNWQENSDKQGYEWADFLADDTRSNKEKLLNEKRKRGR